MEVLNGPMLKDYLKREGRKQQWMENYLGVSRTLLDKIFNGYVPKNPEVVKKLLKLLDCSRAELILEVKLPKRAHA